MEQDVDCGYKSVCCTCLSGDRDLYSINNLTQVYQIFRLLMNDFAGDRLGESVTEFEQLICWECLALMKKILKFKWQVHSAQEHLRVLALSRSQEVCSMAMDHTYMSQSLSSLEIATKAAYDKIYFDFSSNPEEISNAYVMTGQGVKDEYGMIQAVTSGNLNLDINNDILGVPEISLENHTVVDAMSHIVVGSDDLVSQVGTFGSMKGDLHLTISPMPTRNNDINSVKMEKAEKAGFVTEYMTEEEMLAAREEATQKVHFASSVYQCKLCIIGFYNQSQVENHFVKAHKAQPGLVPCKICYTYFEESALSNHLDTHYLRYTCKLCGNVEYGITLAKRHDKTHITRQEPSGVIKIGDVGPITGKGRKRKSPSPKEVKRNSNLRKLLSRTTIEGYQCLECDMFFKNSRARKNHVAKCHREGLQCDHCKKRFVNKTTLATHLRLHEGPLPRGPCPICQKMVRLIQLKYHIQRHQNRGRYECVECNKVFSHITTYQGHLKFSRAHASESVLKFPCPMCDKGYPTKEAMQDHFNYNHLGKTAHKCRICDKPIATRANVERHMLRVHGEKKQKPRNHVCQLCGKAFTDKKSLTQHEVIHSGERPLSCDICEQTFKQKASLYTHKKRVHKVFPSKRVVEYIDMKQEVG